MTDRIMTIYRIGIPHNKQGGFHVNEKKIRFILDAMKDRDVDNLILDEGYHEGRGTLIIPKRSIHFIEIRET